MIPPAIPAGSAAELGGSVFAWQETELAGGARVTPAAPERYTLEFGSDGRVRLRADCNRGSAAFETGADRTLALSAIGTTKMGCPSGSQDAEYLRELGQVDVEVLEHAAVDLVLQVQRQREGAPPHARRGEG